MKKARATIIGIIVLLIMQVFYSANVNAESKKEYIFYLKNQGEYFLNANLLDKQLLNQKIYPGASGYFDVVVNSEDYSFNTNYSLKFFNLKNKPKNLYFIIDNKKIDSLEDLSNITGIINKGNEQIIKRIYWNWDYEGEDNYEELKDLTFDIELTIEREERNTKNRKLPRTGIYLSNFIGVILAVILACCINKVKNIIKKENNEINKNNK